MAPETWRAVPLREVMEPVSRWEAVAPDHTYHLLGVRLYAKGCYKQDAVEGSALRTARLLRIKVGDVVYNKMWATKSAFAVVSAEQDGDFATSEYPAFVPDTARLSLRFLQQVFAEGDLALQAQATCRGSTSRARLNPEDFLSMRIPLPPLAKQETIADVLSAMDDVVACGDVVVRSVEVAKDALAKVLLVGGPVSLRQKSRSGNHTTPPGWKRRRIGELCRFSGGNGFTPRDWARSGLPIVRIQNLNGSREFNYFAGQPRPEWIVEPGDLLFAWAGSRGSSFGPCLWLGPRGVLNQHIHKLSPTPEVDKQFLFYLLRNFTSVVEQRAHGFKDSLVHLRKSELTDLVVALPPLDTQREVVAILGDFEKRARCEIACRDAASHAKRGLARELLYPKARTRVAT